MYQILFVSMLALLAAGCTEFGKKENKTNEEKTNQQPSEANHSVHPEASLGLLREYVKPDVVVLDIGSGSGIGPRQLIANGFKDVVVVEDNQKMIQDSKAATLPGLGKVEYVAAPLDKGLPFPDNKFDLVTAFSAFHCNANPEVVKEVYRVLKPEGYVFIIRGLEKNVDPVRIQTTKIIEAVSGQKAPVINIDAAKMLKDQGFEIIIDKIVPVTEFFTKEEYVNYLKTYCSWKQAEKSPKVQEIDQKIGQFLDTITDKDGVMKIKMEAPVILARKPKS